MIYASQDHSGIFARIDDLHLSRRERLRVNAYMHDGELLAEFICRAAAYVRSAAGGVARAVKLMFASGAKH